MEQHYLREKEASGEDRSVLEFYVPEKGRHDLKDGQHRGQNWRPGKTSSELAFSLGEKTANGVGEESALERDCRGEERDGRSCWET